MIKVVSFDIGGTLIEFSESEENRYSLKVLAALTGVDYRKVRTAYKSVFQKKNGTLEYLINEFCTELEIAVSDDIINFFKNKFYSNNQDALIKDDKIELIKQLKNLGYQVILFSNSCCLIDNKAVMKLDNLVDGIFYSYDIGYTKSESESYRYIEKKMNREAQEFLHIGDTLSSDYFSPIDNGWHALYYGVVEDSQVESINNLVEVINVLNAKIVKKQK